MEDDDTPLMHFYTACYDGNLEDAKRIVEEDERRRAAGGEPEDELLRVDAEVQGGTAFAAAVQKCVARARTRRARARAPRAARAR